MVDVINANMAAALLLVSVAVFVLAWLPAVARSCARPRAEELQCREVQVASGDGSESRGIAVAIAEAYLDALAGGSCEQLQQCLDRRALSNS
jgi:hypothetical protein